MKAGNLIYSGGIVHLFLFGAFNGTFLGWVCLFLAFACLAAHCYFKHFEIHFQLWSDFLNENDGKSSEYIDTIHNWYRERS